MADSEKLPKQIARDMFDPYHEFRDVIEALTLDRAGVPVYPVTYDSKAGGNALQLIGIVVPFDQNHMAIVGIDGSAVIARLRMHEHPKKVNPETDDLIFNASNLRNKQIANVVAGGRYSEFELICDSAEKPDETIALVQRAITEAKQKKAERDANRQKAKPGVLGALRGYIADEPTGELFGPSNPSKE